MDNFNKQEITDPEENFNRGFSKEQILKLTQAEIEDIHLAENTDYTQNPDKE